MGEYKTCTGIIVQYHALAYEEAGIDKGDPSVGDEHNTKFSVYQVVCLSPKYEGSLGLRKCYK